MFCEKSQGRFTGGIFNLIKCHTNNADLRSIISEKEGADEQNMGEKIFWIINFKKLVENISIENVTKSSILKIIAGWLAWHNF